MLALNFVRALGSGQRTACRSNCIGSHLLAARPAGASLRRPRPSRAARTAVLMLLPQLGLRVCVTEPRGSAGVFPGMTTWLKQKKRRFDYGLVLLHLVAGLALLTGPAYLLMFSYTHPRPPRPMPASNCKSIATALELYSSDNGSRYPALDGKFPNFMPSPR